MKIYIVLGAQLIGRVPKIYMDVFKVEMYGHDFTRTTQGVLDKDLKVDSNTPLAVSLHDLPSTPFSVGYVLSIGGITPIIDVGVKPPKCDSLTEMTHLQYGPVGLSMDH